MRGTMGLGQMPDGESGAGKVQSHREAHLVELVEVANSRLRLMLNTTSVSLPITVVKTNVASIGVVPSPLSR